MSKREASDVEVKVDGNNNSPENGVVDLTNVRNAESYSPAWKKIILNNREVVQREDLIQLAANRQRRYGHNTNGCFVCAFAYTGRMINLECQHKLCYNCLRQYLTQNETCNNFCPEETCKREITDQALKLLLLKRDYIEYLEETLLKFRRMLHRRSHEKQNKVNDKVDEGDSDVTIIYDDVPSTSNASTNNLQIPQLSVPASTSNLAYYPRYYQPSTSNLVFTSEMPFFQQFSGPSTSNFTYPSGMPTIPPVSGPSTSNFNYAMPTIPSLSGPSTTKTEPPANKACARRRLSQEQVSELIRLENLEKLSLIETNFEFDCPICFITIQPKEGIILKDCLHTFCKECLNHVIEISENPRVLCPHDACEFFLQDREIKALVSVEVYDKHLKKALKMGEATMDNVFHCKNPNCDGFFTLDPGVTAFPCDVCWKVNCFKCSAIHELQSCEQYKADLENDKKNGDELKLTEAAVRELIEKGNAMLCPQCGVLIEKESGCDFVQCISCKLGICYRTKKPRHPLKKIVDGKTVLIDGCHCRQKNGKKCHPQCGNCH